MGDFYTGMVKEVDQHLGPVFNKYIERTKKQGIDIVNADINQFPALKKWKRKYIEAYSLRHIGSSSGQLLEILKNTPIEDVQKVFGTRLDEWLEKRPGKIARNEVIKASNATLRETYRLGGIKKLKWINTGSKSCDFCSSLNGKIVGIEKNFIEHDEVLEGKTGSGRKLKIYGPKAHPPIHQSCACAIVPVFEAGAVAGKFVKAKTIKEAEEWAKDSKIKETLYHSTDNAADIMKGGFRIDVPVKNGRVNGDGIYFADDIEDATWGNDILKVKINVKNPRSYDDINYGRGLPDSFRGSLKNMEKYGDDGYLSNWDWVGDLGEKHFKEYEYHERITKVLSEMGVDAVTDPRAKAGLVVFDPKNIMIIKE